MTDRSATAWRAALVARDAGWDATRCGSVANAIRLHMHPRVVPEDDDAGYLLNEATSCDVTGYRVGDLPPHAVRDVFARYPRLDFAEGFVARFERQASEKPGCLADLYLQQ